MLFSELAEPTPRRRSPGSEWCVSSESGEVYCVIEWPDAVEDDFVRCKPECEVVPLVSFAFTGTSVGDGCECESIVESRFRFSEPGEMLLLVASTAPPGCDMVSPSPHLTSPSNIAVLSE